MIMKKCLLIIIIFILFAGAIFGIYFLGLPGKDKLAYSSKLHLLDVYSEKICLLMSVNDYSRANKRIGYFNERLYESQSTPVDRNVIANHYDSAHHAIQKIPDSDVKTQLLANLLNNSELVFSLVNIESTDATFQALVNNITEDTRNLPDGVQIKEDLVKLQSTYEPEITTKGASLSTSSLTKITPINSVNLNFIKNKIRAINSKEPIINAVNIISNKGVLSVINMEDNSINGDNTYNLQVFFFRNSSNGLRYIKKDYFESESDIDDFISSYPSFTSSLDIDLEEFDWLCYYHRYAPLEGEDILNYY